VNTRRDVTRVYLQSGKVKIRAAGGEATLQPGQLAEYQEAARTVHVKQADSESWLAWRDNMFVFDDVPLAVVAQAIEDQFGMKVTITNAVQGQQRFTGRIPRQDLDVLLKVVAETLKINITKHRQEVIVQPLAGGD
jgi:ferric-dicitrate binding protein FerR (iron transport regulator)